MSAANDGGPAFPAYKPTESMLIEDANHPGMSLRDWFAGQVVNGSLSIQPPSEELHYGSHNMDLLATWAYGVADAMLAERAKGQP